MKLIINDKNINIFKCLSSKTRLKILQLLYEKPMSVSQLSQILGISCSITSRHISDLQDVGLIRSETKKGIRGQKRICFLVSADISLTFETMNIPTIYKTFSIGIGDFIDFSVSAPCGMASHEKIIGLFDDSRSFGMEEHVDASILWFQKGYVTYRIPGFLFYTKDISSICVTMEICSEYPGYCNDWKSDIYFSINDICLGMWTSPGDFGDKEGIYTPKWWIYGTQYGLLKTVKVSQDGCFIDGIKISDLTLQDLHLQNNEDIDFKIETKENGGINLFGKQFGNYEQDIQVTVEYKI